MRDGHVGTAALLLLLLLLLVLLVLALAAIDVDCSGRGSGSSRSASPASAKIRFDVSALDEDGLHGPPDGLQALSYEFCIPATESCLEEVRAIDPSVQVHPGSPGRIGCSPEEILCTGHTHQTDFRTVLARLAGLEYVERIDRSYFE